MKDSIDKNGFDRIHDFVVEYKILSESEGGRRALPSQGIKWDFCYENPNHASNHLFMIWPQFVDKYGQVIPQSGNPVPSTGKARMWIVDNKMRKYHKHKIHLGLKANGMEGPNVVANYLITEIAGLLTNPVV
ncbi:hypothetical protein ACFQZJ_13460 [Maribacter chungangensis]|uniref:Uncharacterized protein n=1 Tax=Maribacter chungangensis TaxID=1069117 RepID=A0ABW3B648_9FLAO